MKNIQANSAQNSQETNELFERLFVLLPDRIETPVIVKNLERLLIGYLFPHLANYLTSGLRQGFHLGHTGTHFQIAPQNLKSALKIGHMILMQLEKNLNDIISQGHLVNPHYSTFTVHLWEPFRTKKAHGA